MFPRLGQADVDLVRVGLGIVSCGFLVWYGTKVTWENYTNNAYDFFKLREVPIFPSTRLSRSEACCG